MPLPLRSDHPFIFSLSPLNGRAEDVVNHHLNKRLAWTDENGKTLLGIEYCPRSSSKPRTTIATMGRDDNSDIVIENVAISKIHCSFEVHPKSNMIMLHDRSTAKVTEVYGETSCIPFETERERKVVIHPKLNPFLRLGNGEDGLDFEFIWHRDVEETTEKLKNRDLMEIDEDPHKAWTQIVPDAKPLPDTVLPSKIQTRIHTPGPKMPLSIRYSNLAPIGSGRFGTLYKAVNADTGDLFAVKILKLPPRTSLNDWISIYPELKQEIEMLSTSKHKHIVEYIGSQGCRNDSLNAKIFMGLKNGELASLLLGFDLQSTLHLADSALSHMLEALKLLAGRGIIHRDVKPENILFTSLPSGEYHFQLCDFGLCSRENHAQTVVGTPWYRAPEVLESGNQSPKMDVWSLFVTMAWALDVNGFRHILRNTQGDQIPYDVIQAMRENPNLEGIRAMAEFDPYERAPAAEMLRCRQREGIFGRIGQVLPAPPSNTQHRSEVDSPGALFQTIQQPCSITAVEPQRRLNNRHRETPGNGVRKKTTRLTRSISRTYVLDVERHRNPHMSHSKVVSQGDPPP